MMVEKADVGTGFDSGGGDDSLFLHGHVTGHSCVLTHCVYVHLSSSSFLVCLIDAFAPDYASIKITQTRSTGHR